MNTFITILIGFGLAFDVFAIAVSQGSVLGQVKARGLVLMSLIVCGWQVVAMGLGYGISSIPNVEAMSVDARMVWTILSAAILIGLGGIKLFVLNYRKALPEVRSDIDFRKTCGIAASTSIYTLFAGVACGFLMLNAVSVGIMICIMTLGLVVFGVFVGYRNGELDKRIYRSGGIILILAGLIVIGQYIVWYFD